MHFVFLFKMLVKKSLTAQSNAWCRSVKFLTGADLSRPDFFSGPIHRGPIWQRAIRPALFILIQKHFYVETQERSCNRELTEMLIM